jgi:hypothetical protein
VLALLGPAVALAGCSSVPTAGPATGPSSSGSAAATGALASNGSGTTAPSALGLYDAACAGKLRNRTVGAIKTDDITEASGVVVSQQNPGVLWTHNDSGGQPDAYAVTPAGDLLGSFPVEGATNVDWEDLALGPGPTSGQSYLYLGDIGDNAVTRDDVVIYRIPEPTVSATPTAPATSAPPTKGDTITLTYPDGPHNAETLLVDPTTGDLLIVTKETAKPSAIFTVAAAELRDGATVTPRQVGTLERGTTAASGIVSQVTGGDVSADGSVVAIRTYSAVLLYRRAPGQTIAQALAAPPCDGNAAAEIQGEAVGIAPDGQSYYTTSEGRNAPIDQSVIS